MKRISNIEQYREIRKIPGAVFSVSSTLTNEIAEFENRLDVKYIRDHLK